MQTHLWNDVLANNLRESRPGSHLLRVACSVASQDGVYSAQELADLADDDSELLTTIAWHLAKGTGVYDLNDLRQELRDLEARG